MNNKNAKILQAVFSEPTAKDLPWEAVEALFRSLGATQTEGRGSRVKFDLERRTLSLHRPHHPNMMRCYQVESIREFLQELGIKP